MSARLTTRKAAAARHKEIVAAYLRGGEPFVLGQVFRLSTSQIYRVLRQAGWCVSQQRCARDGRRGIHPLVRVGLHDYLLCGDCRNRILPLQDTREVEP